MFQSLLSNDSHVIDLLLNWNIWWLTDYWLSLRRKQACLLKIWYRLLHFDNVGKNSDRHYRSRTQPMFWNAQDDVWHVGSNMQFLNLLDSATEPDSRAQVLYYILRASKNGLQAIAKDESSMHVLKGWIKDLLEDPQSFHVMELILTVCLPLNPKHSLGFKSMSLACPFVNILVHSMHAKQYKTHKNGIFVLISWSSFQYRVLYLANHRWEY